MESDGSAVRNLTNTIFADNEAVWSPDGGQIAFVSYRDGGSHIWLMNADGTNLRKLETGGYSLRTQIAIIGLVTVASLSLIGGGWYLWRRRSEIAVIAA
jgi:hypothetical protein